MAAINTLFRYAAIPVWPRNFGLRLLSYLLLSLVAWLVPPWGAIGALFAVLLLGRKTNWLQWLIRLRWLWLFILAPIIVELIDVFSGTGRMAPAALLTATWRSLSFLVLLAGSQWLTQSTTIFEIRGALQVLFRIFGKSIADTLSLVGSLALCFLPWVMAEMQAVREAGQIRCLPAHRPILALRSLSLPIGVRLIQKARHTAEALELRGK